jgi:hypothetical protein
MRASAQSAPFGLRMPSDLKEWVQKQAEQNRRSLTSEIVVRLEQSRKQEEKQNAVHQ